MSLEGGVGWGSWAACAVAGAVVGTVRTVLYSSGLHDSTVFRFSGISPPLVLQWATVLPVLH